MKSLTISVTLLLCASAAFAQADVATFAKRCGVDPSTEKAKMLVRQDGAWQRPPVPVGVKGSDIVYVWHEKNWLVEWNTPEVGSTAALFCFSPKKKLIRSYRAPNNTLPEYKKLEQLPFWGFLKD